MPQVTSGVFKKTNDEKNMCRSFSELWPIDSVFVAHTKFLQNELGGGFKYFVFSPLLGEMIQFDEQIFQMGGSTTN